VTEAAEAGIAHPGEGDDGRLLHAADRHQDVGAVDHRPEHDHHVAGLDGDVVRRLQLGQGGVGLAEVGKGGAEGGAGVGLLGAGTHLDRHGHRLLGRPSRLCEAVHQAQVLGQRTQHPGPLHRGLGLDQADRLLLLAEGFRVSEGAQAARELLVEQAGPLPLARLVDQRQGPAQQLHGPGVVTAV
jgi:hypothetical protein